MKKQLFLVAALVLLVLVSGFAEGTTWSNPNDLLTGFYPVPRSMLSAVSNGIYYDEIDTIILSPAELSNYSGFSIFTGYGNYEYDYIKALTTTTDDASFPNNFVNPFTTTDIDQNVADNFGNFLLGATGELFDHRGGVIAGFEFGQTNDLNIGGAVSQYTKEQSVTTDDDADGTADFTYTNSETYTDYVSTSLFRFGAGVDLGFMGASLYSVFNNQIASFGGNYTYVRPLSGDADQVDPNDIVTSKVVTYGNKEEGKTGMDPDDTYSDWLFGVRGHLPLEIADISMPVKVDFIVGSKDSPAAAYNPKKTVSISATNLTGITDAAKVNSITASYGTSSVTNWNAQTDAGVLGADPVYASGTFRGLVTSVENGGAGFGYALDPENFSDSNFKTGVEGLIDPEFIVTDVFSVRTRGQFGYMFDMTKTNNAGIRSVSYTEAVEASTTASEYNFSSSVTAPRTVFNNIVDIELGGILDLHNEEDTLGVSCGVFYHPTLTFQSTSVGDSVTTISESWIDESATDPEIAAWPVYNTGTLGPGIAQGIYTSQSTVVTDKGTGGNVDRYENKFYIPASTRVRFAKGALELIGGYLLQNSTTTTVTTNYTNNTTTTDVETLTNSSGAVITAPADSLTVADVAAVKTVKKARTESEWAGKMSFMLRWNAMKGMTVDFYGATIMSALDFEVFGEGLTDRAGFNPASFIDSLGISVTISAK